MSRLESSALQMIAKNGQHSDGGRIPRVAVFIDGSNFYHSLEENCSRFDVDFSAFVNKLCGERTLFRAYYYNVLRDPDRNQHAYQEQQKFLGTLYSTPYLEVRLGGSKIRGDVAIEKGIDIMLATDLLRLAWEDLYDVGILVSGDGDFAYAVQAVKDVGKHIEVAAFQSNLSLELSNAADTLEAFVPTYFSSLWSKNRTTTRSKSESKNNPSRRGWRLGRLQKNVPKTGTE